MRCQILFSLKKQEKNINFSSAELAKKVVKVIVKCWNVYQVVYLQEKKFWWSELYFSSPELCTGWAFVITFRPSSVRPSVNIFKRLLLWSRWANFAQISYGASLGWGNERLLNGRGPLTKMAALPIYGKKTLKIVFSRTEDALGLNLCTNHRGREVYQSGWICAQIIGDRISTKVAKKVVVCWHLTFLQQGQVYFPMRLYEPRNICMGKLFRISDDFSSEATEPNLLKF